MLIDDSVSARRVTDDAGRRDAMDVLQATYYREKSWIADAENEVSPADIAQEGPSWFVASVHGRPAGVLRVLYDPPLAAYAEYGFKLIDPSVDVADFLRRHRIAEIGRFAVMPRYRRGITVAAALMRAAVAETVARGYTHYVTDVFEDDPHSPYQFHTRVMGFFPVATHDVGELQCRSRRITMMLDLKQAYKRLQKRGTGLFRYLTDSWDDALHRHMAA